MCTLLYVYMCLHFFCSCMFLCVFLYFFYARLYVCFCMFVCVFVCVREWRPEPCNQMKSLLLATSFSTSGPTHI